MAGLNYLRANEMIDHLFRNTPNTPPALLNLVLLHQMPWKTDLWRTTLDTCDGELGYVDQEITFAAADSEGMAANNAPIAFQADGPWVRPALYAAICAGDGRIMIWWVMKRPWFPKAPGDILYFEPGDITVRAFANEEQSMNLWTPKRLTGLYGWWWAGERCEKVILVDPHDRQTYTKMILDSSPNKRHMVSYNPEKPWVSGFRHGVTLDPDNELPDCRSYTGSEYSTSWPLINAERFEWDEQVHGCQMMFQDGEVVLDGPFYMAHVVMASRDAGARWMWAHSGYPASTGNKGKNKMVWDQELARQQIDIIFDDGATIELNDNRTLPNGGQLIEIMRNAAGQLFLIRNGVDVTHPNLFYGATLKLDGFGWDGRPDSQAYWDDYCGELIICTALPSDAQLAELRAYMNAKWALWDTVWEDPYIPVAPECAGYV